MTVIAAVVDQGRVWMAADSYSLGPYEQVLHTRKIDRLTAAGETILLASCGRAGIGPLAARQVSSCRPPGRRADPDGWAQGMAEAITDTCRARGHVDSDGDLDGELLLAWRHRLWVVSMDLAQPVGTYIAIGSGRMVALGAMWATPDAPPERRVGLAVEAAIEHVAHIGGPVLTEATSPRSGRRPT